MRFLFLFLLVVAAGLYSPAAAQPLSTDCGTCTTMGFACIAPGNPQHLTNLCGIWLDPASCPIAACAPYCQAQLGDPEATGTCNDGAHLCNCAAAPPPLTTATPTPIPVLPSSPAVAIVLASPAQAPTHPPRDCGTCQTQGFACIAKGNPRRLANACGHRLDPATCPIASCTTYCQAQAGTEAVTGLCNDDSHLCLCTGSPPPRPVVDTTAEGPPTLHVSTAPPILIETESVPTATVLESDDEISATPTTIAAMSVMSALVFLMVVNLGVHAVRYKLVLPTGTTYEDARRAALADSSSLGWEDQDGRSASRSGDGDGAVSGGDDAEDVFI